MQAGDTTANRTNNKLNRRVILQIELLSKSELARGSSSLDKFLEFQRTDSLWSVGRTALLSTH